MTIKNLLRSMILTAMLFGAFSTNLYALQDGKRVIKIYYVNGMSTLRKDAEKQKEALQETLESAARKAGNLMNWYEIELVYSQTSNEEDGDWDDALDIINFQDEMRACDEDYYSYDWWLQDNCDKKEYLKKQLVDYTVTYPGIATYIISYSRGNILANVAMEEVDRNSNYFADGDSANMDLVGRMNIASPGRLKYGSKYTTIKLDRVISKVSWVISGAKGNRYSYLYTYIKENYRNLLKNVGGKSWNEIYFGNSNGHSLTNTYLNRLGLKYQIQKGFKVGIKELLYR